MKLTVIGTGYVGLISGVCFAKLGHQVIGIDIDANRVQNLQDGNPTFFEPGLKSLLKENLKQETISFTTDWSFAISGAEVIFIAVGTPLSRRGDRTWLFFYLPKPF